MMVLSDLKYAIRLLMKRPSFTILTILVMTAGMGISVYLFSLMNPIVFKALPFEDGESLVQLSGSQNGQKRSSRINLHDYHEIRNNVKGLTEFSAYTNTSVNVSSRDGARRYNAISAEPNLFQLTRTKPVLGREFSNVENQEGAERVVLIGYDIWQNQFAGNPEIIDQALRIDGESHRIIGVMPQGYYFPNIADMWIPMREDATQITRGNSSDFFGLAHIKDGHSMEEINREIGLVMQRIETRYPKTNDGIGAYIATIPMTMVGDGIVIVYSMHIIAVLILLLASINVGNLLLSRAVERGKETAIRVALGAPRSRLIGQMLWESIIICGVGGIIGLLVAAWGLKITNSVIATFWFDKPNFWWQVGIDAFSIKIFVYFILGTVLVTGLLPAWRNSGSDFNAVLRDGTRGALGKKAGRLNKVLVISEIFISMTVLIAAGVIMVATYLKTHADFGAKTDNILTAEIQLTEKSYGTPEEQAVFFSKLESRLESDSNIGNVMFSSALPSVTTSTPTMAVEGREYAKDETSSYPRANYILVSTGSLQKFGIELKDGRYFSSVDKGTDKNSVIVTDSFAARHFPDETAVGKRIRVVESDGDTPNWMTIVGIVNHTSQGQPNERRGKIPSVFRPYSQAPRNRMTIALEMKSDTTVAIQALRKTLQSIDSDLPAFRVETFADKILRGSAATKMMSTIFLLFGIAAAVLAASGIYGVMSNTINQRTQEIGIKRALGAWEERVTKEFLFMGLKQLLWGGIPGLLAGGAMGFALSQVMGTGSASLISIAILMVIVIGGVVMLATYYPTKRALAMEPSDALRYE